MTLKDLIGWPAKLVLLLHGRNAAFLHLFYMVGRPVAKHPLLLLHGNLLWTDMGRSVDYLDLGACQV